MIFLKYKSDHNIPLLKTFDGSLLPSRQGLDSLGLPCLALVDLFGLSGYFCLPLCPARPSAPPLLHFPSHFLTSPWNPLPSPFHWLTTTYSSGPSLQATSSWKPSRTGRLCWVPLLSAPFVPCMFIIRPLAVHFLPVFSSMLSVRAQSRLSHLPLSQKVPGKCLNE